MCSLKRRAAVTPRSLRTIVRNFGLRPTGRPGTIKLPEGVEMVMPGDNVQMEVELVPPIACEEGLRFAIREGGRTVGAGVVTGIAD